jgi:hypothetical protein
MRSIQLKGIVRNGRVEVAEPIDLPDGSEVTISGNGSVASISETDRPMTPREIAETLAAMDKVEPFEMTDEERASADDWERKVNEYTIANMDKGIEDVFR